MPTITVHGASDDLIEVGGPCWYNGIVWADGNELSANGWDKMLAATLYVVDDSGNPQAVVRSIYDGTWSFAIGMVDEDRAWPDFPVRVVKSDVCPYSMALEIEVPEGHYLIHEGDM